MTTSSDPSSTVEPMPSTQDVADLLAASESATVYLAVALDDATREALLVEQQLHSELDAVRGVDAVRKATDEEIAETEAEAEAEAAPAVVITDTSSAPEDQPAASA